jgi:hypothetical protein
MTDVISNRLGLLFKSFQNILKDTKRDDVCYRMINMTIEQCADLLRRWQWPSVLRHELS